MRSNCAYGARTGYICSLFSEQNKCRAEALWQNEIGLFEWFFIRSVSFVFYHVWTFVFSGAFDYFDCSIIFGYDWPPFSQSTLIYQGCSERTTSREKSRWGDRQWENEWLGIATETNRKRERRMCIRDSGRVSTNTALPTPKGSPNNDFLFSFFK